MEKPKLLEYDDVKLDDVEYFAFVWEVNNQFRGAWGCLGCNESKMFSSPSPSIKDAMKAAWESLSEHHAAAHRPASF